MAAGETLGEVFPTHTHILIDLVLLNMQRRKHFKLSKTEQKIRYIKHMSISFVL